MTGTNGTGVYSRDATKELDERLGRRLDEMNGVRSGVRSEPATEAVEVPPQGGFSAYVRRNIGSKVVQMGIAGLLAFGAGAAYHSDVSASYKSAKQFAGKCVDKGISYVTNAVFSMMPQEQKQKVLRDTVTKMSPEELLNEMNKIQPPERQY